MHLCFLKINLTSFSLLLLSWFVFLYLFIMVLQIHFLNELNVSNAAAKMTMGQMSEAIFILAIPFLFYRIGVKNMLLLGMTAWILRYVCFAYGNTGANLWMLYAGIILHGVCYDFFFVTGYMYTEKKAGEKIKNAAQGLFTFATYGVGMFIGTWFSGFIVDKYKLETGHDWLKIWFVPAYIAVGVLGLFYFYFFRKKRDVSQAVNVEWWVAMIKPTMFN